MSAVHAVVQKLAITCGLAATSIALAAAAARIPLVQIVELKTYDARVRRTVDQAAARNDVVLIDIDENSLRRMEPLVGRWPWPRLVHGHVVDLLARGPARAVLYDVLFTERDQRSFNVGSEQWTGAESDHALAMAVSHAGNVVLMADAVAEPTERDAARSLPLPQLDALAAFHLSRQPEERPIIDLPIDELAHAARAIGHNFLVLDPDGPVRRVVPFVRSGDQPLASGPLSAVLVATATPADKVDMADDTLVVGNRRAPLVAQTLPNIEKGASIGYRALINYGGAYPHFSFYDLFYAEQQILAGAKPNIDPSVFRDKIVIVGTTAPGLSDVFTVPLSGKMSGSEVAANFVDSLLSSRFMAPAQLPARAASLVLSSLVVAATAVWLGPWVALGGAVLASGFLWWTAIALFRAGVWLPLVEPATAIALATFSGTAYHYLVEGREKRKVKHLFSRFVSHDVYQQLLDDPSRAALGGERREMSVLFSDIRGFTTIAEGSAPEAIVAALNEYFTRMVPIVFEHHGTVDKFVGDMVMALFGAPLDDPDHADHAVQTALAMTAALDGLNRERAVDGRLPFDIGIGINSGEMVAGIVGSDRISSYTVIGDAVNLGSRLESLNKQHSTRIIISDATRRLLKRRYDTRPLGEVTVKGRSQPVSIFEVKGVL